MLKIFATLPVSSCEPERIFSKVEHTMTAIRASMCEERLESLIVEKAGVSKWGLRGRVREGVYSLPPEGLGDCVPGKNFQITDARRWVLAHFPDKNQYIAACKLW
jgi:hypothetical protein